MTTPLDALPSDLAGAHAMILAERARANAASASAEAMIAHLSGAFFFPDGKASGFQTIEEKLGQ
jgi:hypothetical protein